MSAARERKYVHVESCEKLNSPHDHIETEDNVYCHGVGGWVKDLWKPKEPAK